MFPVGMSSCSSVQFKSLKIIWIYLQISAYFDKKYGKMDTLKRMHSDPDSVLCPAFVRSQRYKAGEIPAHRHRRGQLLCASEGVITVRTDDGLWVIPPQRAVWIAPGTLHTTWSSKRFRL